MPTPFDPIREDALDAARTDAHERDADWYERAAAAAEDARERLEQERREGSEW